MKSRNTIKVLHVVLSMAVGGAEKLVHDMILATPGHKYTPYLCCLQECGVLGEKLEAKGVKIYCLDKKDGMQWEIVKSLREIVKSEGIDVIHAHQYTPLFYSAVATLFLPRMGVVYTEHGRLHPDRRRLKRFLFNPFLALMTDVMISISESTLQAMRTIDNFPARKIRVIRNGVDFSRFRREKNPTAAVTLSLPPDALVVGTAARLEAIKNIPMMLRGFQIVLRRVPSALLLIAGDGSRRMELQALAQELRIERKVLFLGMRDDLEEILPLCRVFLLSSFSEGISVTLLESMACGIPSVVTKVGGNSEIVVDGVTGFLVESDDHLGMAERVIHYLQNPGRAEVDGANAYQRVVSEFSFQGMLGAYFHCYDKLCGVSR